MKKILFVPSERLFDRRPKFRFTPLLRFYCDHSHSFVRKRPGPLAYYKSLVNQGKLQHDPYQENVALELDNLLGRLGQYEKDMEEFHTKLAKWEEDRENERRKLLMEEAEAKQQAGVITSVNKRRNYFQRWMSRKPDNVEPGVGKWVSYLNREKKLDSLVGQRPTAPPSPKGLYIYGNVGSADALLKLEERGIVVRFVIGRSANRGDSLDRNIDEENRITNDFLILDRHEEAQEELSKKAKFFFSTAVQMWDADFYVKVDDNIDLHIDGLIELVQSRRDQHNAYIGCMKSGEVITEEGRPWYEPEWWKFGDQKSYFRHAAGSIFILSKSLANYININSASLKAYAHDDISVGSWMMGLQSTYIDDSRLCCSYSGQDKVCSMA